MNNQSTQSNNAGPNENELRVVAERFKPADFEPFIRQASESLYETIMHSCEDYLRENVQWNIGSHIQMLERENQRMRTELFEVDRAIGCVSMGHDNRIATIHNAQEQYRQVSTALHVHRAASVK